MWFSGKKLINRRIKLIKELAVSNFFVFQVNQCLELNPKKLSFRWVKDMTSIPSINDSKRLVIKVGSSLLLKKMNFILIGWIP